MKPFNPESWYTQHSHIAEKNEKRAQAALADGNKITASEYFLRAAGFWRSAIIYLPEADDRMMKGYSPRERSLRQGMDFSTCTF